MAHECFPRGRSLIDFENALSPGLSSSDPDFTCRATTATTATALVYDFPASLFPREKLMVRSDLAAATSLITAVVTFIIFRRESMLIAGCHNLSSESRARVYARHCDGLQGSRARARARERILATGKFDFSREKSLYRRATAVEIIGLAPSRLVPIYLVAVRPKQQRERRNKTSGSVLPSGSYYRRRFFGAHVIDKEASR